MASGSNDLKVLLISDACVRLDASSEIAALACHTYHQFQDLMGDKMRTLDIYAVSGACIKLAHAVHEVRLKTGDLILVLLTITRGAANINVDENFKDKLAKTIDVYSTAISFKVGFNITFQDQKQLTPGELNQQRIANMRPLPAYMLEPKGEDSDGDTDSPFTDDDAELRDDMMLRNPRVIISPQRYLLHFLNIMKLLVEPAQENSFYKLCNIAWVILNDLYWHPIILLEQSRKLACGCIMLAIRICRKDFEQNDEPTKMRLWQYVNKKWNLIFCDDFTSKQLDVLLIKIVNHFNDFECLLGCDLEFDAASMIRL